MKITATLGDVFYTKQVCAPRSEILCNIQAMGGEWGAFRLVTVQLACRLILADLIMDLPWFELKSSYFCWILVFQSVLLSSFFNFERVLLETRGCSCTLKIPNYPPLIQVLTVSTERREHCFLRHLKKKITSMTHGHENLNRLFGFADFRSSY